MSGIVIVCAGRRKTGKTTYTKKLLKASKLPKYIYDVNKEYEEFHNKKDLERMPVFLDKAITLEGHYMVFEEATIFFTPRGGAPEEMRHILVRARHSQSIIQLNFHSFNSMPKDIKNMADYIVVFKTNDNEIDVINRFDNPKVIEAWKRAQNSKNPYYYESVNLY